MNIGGFEINAADAFALLRPQIDPIDFAAYMNIHFRALLNKQAQI